MTEIRKELEEFSVRQEFVLQENDIKQHWSRCTQDYLNSKLQKSAHKLQNAVCSNDCGAVIKYSVDVANYCMMLADNAKTKLKSQR